MTLRLMHLVASKHLGISIRFQQEPLQKVLAGPSGCLPCRPATPSNQRQAIVLLSFLEEDKKHEKHASSPSVPQAAKIL